MEEVSCIGRLAAMLQLDWGHERHLGRHAATFACLPWPSLCEKDQINVKAEISSILKPKNERPEVGYRSTRLPHASGSDDRCFRMGQKDSNQAAWVLESLCMRKKRAIAQPSSNSFYQHLKSWREWLFPLLFLDHLKEHEHAYHYRPSNCLLHYDGHNWHYHRCRKS